MTGGQRERKRLEHKRYYGKTSFLYSRRKWSLEEDKLVLAHTMPDSESSMMPSYIDCDVDVYFTPEGCLFPEYLIKSVSLNGETFWVNEEVAHEDNAYKLLANSLQ